MKPIRIINSVAPMRICDNGGWTDTWFARHGKIFNIAVCPRAEIQMRVFQASYDRPRITIDVENYGDRYAFDKPKNGFDKHPLLEAALDFPNIPSDVSI